jgi:hypothetical protein
MARVDAARSQTLWMGARSRIAPERGQRQPHNPSSMPNSGDVVDHTKESEK